MKDPSLLLAKQFECEIRLGALEEKEAHNISASSFHLQDWGFCASYQSPCPHQRKQFPTDTTSEGPRANHMSMRLGYYLLLASAFGASTVESTIDGMPPSGVRTQEPLSYRIVGRAGLGACCFGYVKDTEGTKLTKESMCAIHGILWSRELKLSQCHNRTVVTTPSVFVSERW